MKTPTPVFPVLESFGNIANREISCKGKMYFNRFTHPGGDRVEGPGRRFEEEKGGPLEFYLLQLFDKTKFAKL